MWDFILESVLFEVEDRKHGEVTKLRRDGSREVIEGEVKVSKEGEVGKLWGKGTREVRGREFELHNTRGGSIVAENAIPGARGGGIVGRIPRGKDIERVSCDAILEREQGLHIIREDRLGHKKPWQEQG